MRKHGRRAEQRQAVEQVLGYLNFSSGAPDANFLCSLNTLWRLHQDTEGQPIWQAVGRLLKVELQQLGGQSAAFRDAQQATKVLQLVWDDTIPAYLEFHRDLLFHQDANQILNAFMVARICEAVLSPGGPWDETDRVVRSAIARLNDYIGHRPVAVLEGRKIEPYPHELIRPVPLYVRGAGAAAGRYEQVVLRALELLEQAGEDILVSAGFDVDALEELAYDPRAYDFDHPANKRPNYHFGQWDPHHIDNKGRYTRFVVQEVSLNALMHRFDTEDLPAEELLFETAAVLAGIILMAAGVSGSGPDSHDSTTTLTTLLPRIAAYRDAFYERLIHGLGESHRQRLLAEANERRQPFGAARQHLNAQLARHRAAQLEHVQLAKLFARMGYPEAASKEAAIIPTASARLMCSLDCRLSDARAALTSHQPDRCAELLREIVAILHRGIACGAIVDPWNILGFDAQFSLFPALENAVHDHRVEELVLFVEEIFGIYSRAWSEAAAADDEELSGRLSTDFRDLVDWWRRFAPHEVSHVEAMDARDAYQAAEHVARALNLWHKEDAAAGDIGFWAPHAEMFDSAQAYALVVEAMLEQTDLVAAMGLLIHWLSESQRIPLEQGEGSFHRLAERWLNDLCQAARKKSDGNEQTRPLVLCGDTWRRMRKFFDYLEANADEYWHIPSFEFGSTAPASDATVEDEPFEEDEEEEDLYGAAYENVVFRDSADDGIEGEIFDTGDLTEDALACESERILERLHFHGTLARMWKSAGLYSLDPSCDAELHEDRRAAIRHWASKLQHNRSQLLELLEQVRGYRLTVSQGDHESMIEYDRRRLIKESLLDQVISTSVESADAACMLQAALAAECVENNIDDWTEESLTIQALAAILRRDHAAASNSTSELLVILEDQPLLYVPLAKGGDPRQILDARIRQRHIQDLLTGLPRLGLYLETHRLIETAREMERDNPVGAGAVTEFDELFKIGYRAIVQSLVASASDWPEEHEVTVRPRNLHDSPLVACLEQITEVCLHSWLAHSQTLRLSVLEKVNDKQSWQALVTFIQRYGGELFTQRFLNLGNVRAILHQGVDDWLERITEDTSDLGHVRLFNELGNQISFRDAVQHLTLILEAIVENYGEYRDYNSTTTQSDRGELLDSLLDFLRLRTKYDRVCWNLKPVVIAHEVLVRNGCKQAAQLWRRALRDRIEAEATKFVDRLNSLQKKYAMQMPSVADRIQERFVRPLIIDRVRALVEPAVAEAKRDGPRPTFRMLQYETEFLTREPSGVGFDLPPWLAALDEEVQRVTHPVRGLDFDQQFESAIPMTRLSYEETVTCIDEWVDADDDEVEESEPDA